MTDLIVGDPPLDAMARPGRGELSSSSTQNPGEPSWPTAINASDANRLQPFAPVILAVRWATTGVSVALASPAALDLDVAVLPWLGLVLTNTVIRTLRPLRYTGSTRSLVVLLLEICLHVIAVIATGYWDSPLVLLMINAVVVAGFARGFSFSIRIGAASTLAVSIPALAATEWSAEAFAQSAQWTTLLLLGGIVAGYSRRISGEATLQHSLALDRVARLADANALLTNLHRVAQTLPASLDRGDVLDSTLSRLRSLVAHDAAVILTREDTDGKWSVAARSAVSASGDISLNDIPVPARRAIGNDRLVRVENLTSQDMAFNQRALSAMYIPLLARGRLVGLLGVESMAAASFSSRDAQVLRGFVEPVALAIDNTRWFDRIRTVGADEERNRIARDLHDRIGQSLAYLGFEIDALIRREAAGEPVDEPLRVLRDDLRAVIGEVRDTLSDLRTDVTDHRDFAKTAHDFSARIAERSNLTIDLDCDTDRRLPILQEREMWRIAQEALVNVERHAKATEVSILWRCDSRGALLEVVDNGQGLPPKSADGRMGRSDSYGILGMRERADSVGATLELASEPGEGTKVRCFLAHR